MTPTDTTPNIASLSTEEKLRLMEVLAANHG
jgi:hypothetical protein